MDEGKTFAMLFMNMNLLCIYSGWNIHGSIWGPAFWVRYTLAIDKRDMVWLDLDHLKSHWVKCHFFEMSHPYKYNYRLLYIFIFVLFPVNIIHSCNLAFFLHLMLAGVSHKLSRAKLGLDLFPVVMRMLWVLNK